MAWVGLESGELCRGVLARRLNSQMGVGRALSGEREGRQWLGLVTAHCDGGTSQLRNATWATWAGLAPNRTRMTRMTRMTQVKRGQRLVLAVPRTGESTEWWQLARVLPCPRPHRAWPFYSNARVCLRAFGTTVRPSVMLSGCSGISVLSRGLCPADTAW